MTPHNTTEDLPIALILDAADHAARTIMGRGSRWWPEDWEDAKAEAVLGILETIRKKPDAGPGYCYRAGVSSICDWLRLWLKGDRPFQLYEYIDDLIETDTTLSRAMLANLPALVPMLRQQRQRWGPVLERSLEQEVRFLQLILDGYSIDGAALELGISIRNTYAIRERLLPRLKAICTRNRPN
jgi:hypothetical protein